jgi:hypothetical protein
MSLESKLAAARFLEYNRDEAFKNLLAAEEHLRFAKPGSTGEEAGCIVKHLAEVESHADEGVSHSSELGLDEEARLWRELRDRARRLRYRVMAEGVVRPEEMIREVRSLRHFLESWNPELSALSCQCTGEAQEAGQRGEVKAPAPEVGERGVVVVQVRGGSYSKPEERLNREPPARLHAMATWRDVLVIYGGLHVGKGVLRLLKEVDNRMGWAANPPSRRLTTWVAVGAGVAAPFVAMNRRIRSPWDTFALLVGGYLSTYVWDVAEEVAATGVLLSPPLSLAPRTFALPPAQAAPAPAPAPAQAAPAQQAPAVVTAGAVAFEAVPAPRATVV